MKAIRVKDVFKDGQITEEHMKIFDQFHELRKTLGYHGQKPVMEFVAMLKMYVVSMEKELGVDILVKPPGEDSNVQ